MRFVGNPKIQYDQNTYFQSVSRPDDWDYRNKEMQILKRELQMLCDEEKEMAREKTARQQLVIRNKLKFKNK